MSVNNLETPERGMNIETRDPRGTDKVKADIERVKKAAEADLRAMLQRIDDVRELKPDDLHCSHCVQAFAAGRDAAIKAIEGA